MRSFKHILPGGQYLKHCQDSSWECVKVGRRGLIFKIKPRREMMSCESFSWMSLMCTLRSQLCSNFQNLSFFQFVCLQRQQKQNWYLPIIMFHLHIKAELNSPLYISGTNNKNIINMLSYFTILLHVHSQGLCRGLITTECREMLKKREETSHNQGLVYVILENKSDSFFLFFPPNRHSSFYCKKIVQ